MMENLSTVYKRVQKYASEADVERYDMQLKEVRAMIACSSDMVDLVFLAFNFGFAKGCRKTKKAVKS